MNSKITILLIEDEASISKLMYVGVPKRVQQVTVDNQAQQQMH